MRFDREIFNYIAEYFFGTNCTLVYIGVNDSMMTLPILSEWLVASHIGMQHFKMRHQVQYSKEYVSILGGHLGVPDAVPGPLIVPYIILL